MFSCEFCEIFKSNFLHRTPLGAASESTIFYLLYLLYESPSNHIRTHQYADLYYVHTLRKQCPYLELFWSTFSCIRTENGEILRTLSIQSKCGKMRNRITPNTDTFYAVTFTLFMRIGLKTRRIDINAIKFKRSSYFTVSKCSKKVCKA